MISPICKTCINCNICETPCAAIEALYQIYDAQDDKDKMTRIRNLKKQLGIQDAEPSKVLKRLADQIIKRFPEFGFIREYNIKIAYVTSQERKRGEKVTYADCRKVQDVFKAYLPFDFIITFYARNTDSLSENQQKILMLHELRHVTIGQKGLKIRPHDIEDFADILEPFGLDWNEPGKELPDILGGE